MNKDTYLSTWRIEVLQGLTLLGFRQWLASRIGVIAAVAMLA